MISRLLSYQIFSLVDDGYLFGINPQLFIFFRKISVLIIAAVIVAVFLIIDYLIKKHK